MRGTRSGAAIIVAIHSTDAGPATGGCRVRSYPSWRDGMDDALRLSAAMTTKCALADLPHGGGKMVVALSDTARSPHRADLLADISAVVASFEGRYITGPDIGTGPEDMAFIHGASGGHAFCRPERHGGSGNSSVATARGVLAALRAATEETRGRHDVSGLRVGVIGYGHVGSLIATALQAEGADVRAFDVDETVRPALEAAGVTWWRDPSLRDELDILVPAATGGILTRTNAETCGARLIVGPANNQIADDAVDELLHHRGVTWVPDVLASGGGVAYAVSREGLGKDEDESNRLVDRIGQTTHELFEQMRSEQSTPLQAARSLAARRIRGAA